MSANAIPPNKWAKAVCRHYLSLPGQVVGRVISQYIGNLINAPMNALGGAYIAKHSRGDEFEADQLGQQPASRAGYDPQAMATFLDRLGQVAEIISEEKHRPGWFDTHPSTPDRVTRVSRDAQRIEWVHQPAVVGDKSAYLFLILNYRKKRIN